MENLLYLSVPLSLFDMIQRTAKMKWQVCYKNKIDFFLNINFMKFLKSGYFTVSYFAETTALDFSNEGNESKYFEIIEVNAIAFFHNYN